MSGVMTRASVFAALLLSAGAAGCASTGATPRPFPTPGSHGGPTPVVKPPKPSDGALSPTGYAIAGTALSLRGSPYRNGGSDPSGFDCSGFVQYVFAQHGVAVPRTVDQQFRAGRDVEADRLEPGDLVFFRTSGNGVSHVGIAIGGDEFIDAPSGHGSVRVERLSTPYWSTRFAGIRRLK